MNPAKHAERSSFRGVLSFLGPVAVGAALVGAAVMPATARAEGPVTGTAKGIVGGAFLGAEVVMMPMGIAGLKPWWPYVVFGGVGSVGGAIGGWAVEQAAPPAEAPLYMLAGGLALVIPTLVLTLNATTKKNYDDDSTTTPAPSTDDKNKPPGDQKAPDGTTVTVTSSAKDKIPEGVPSAAIDLRKGAIRIGIPAVEIRQMYTPIEVAEFGVSQKTEVRIPVFSAAF